MNYTSMIRRNMAAMIDVSTNDTGAEFKQRKYQVALDSLDPDVEIRTMDDVDRLVTCGPRIRRRIEHIINHNDDLPEVKEFFEASTNAEDESSWDTASEVSYASVTTQGTDSEDDDDSQYVHDSESGTDTNDGEDSENDGEDSENDGEDEESVGENEYEVEVLPTQIQVLRAINAIEYSMMNEDGAMTVTDALSLLHTIRTFVLHVEDA